MATDTIPTISLVLLGKTGQGKSSTGNSLLGVYRFEESNNMMSETKVVVNYTVDYKGEKLKVFDTPGYFDADIQEKSKSVKWSLGNMETLMEISRQRCEVIDAFLLVIKSIERFSTEYKETIEAFEQTFGEEFLTKHCIIVITMKDLMEKELNEWLKHQTGAFKELYKKCENRVVAVCNKDSKSKEATNEHNEKLRLKTREDILDAVSLLKKKYPEGYSYEDFAKPKHVESRYKLLLNSELNTLKASFDNKLTEIKEKKKGLKNKSERDNLLQEIAVLRFSIKEKDKGTGLLKQPLNEIEEVEGSVPPMNSFCTLM